MVAGKFQEHELTPAIVKVAPPAAAKVTYQCGAEVNFGADLTPLQVKDEPAVVWPADAAHLYTLCMTDPDAPNRKEPVNGQILHWLVVNIPGTDISKGQVLAAYRGSGPSVLSGKHRYAFFVYQQPSRIEPDEKPIDKTSVEGRRNFKLQVYSEKYHLGNPIAGNFFQAEADDYSAELHKDRYEQQLKFVDP